jgi:hypothetical protein
MSFMLKIAFALPLTFAAAFGHGTSTSVDQATTDPVLNRASCSVCDEVYDSCIAEGITPAGCHRMTANCYRTCLP